MTPDAGSCLGTYLDFWLDHARGRVRTKTWEGYEALVRRHAKPALGEISLAALSPLDIQGLYSSLLAGGLSGGTVLNLHLVLTNALSQAVRWGILGQNPAQGAQPPRPKRAAPAVIDQRLAETILAAAAGDRLECAVALAIATGMRRGELLGLRWADIAGDGSLAQVKRSLQLTRGGKVREEDPKTARSRRQVALPAFARPYIARQREDQARRRREEGKTWVGSGIVIDRGDGAPWNPGSFGTAWVLFLKKKGLPRVRFHDLRHAHATLMLSKGVHPKIVSERLGHASVGITLDTYSHVLPSMQQEAAAAFDELFGSEPQESDAMGSLARDLPSPPGVRSAP